MNNKLLAAQIVNIIGLSIFLFLITSGISIPIVEKLIFYFSELLVLGSLIALVILSSLFRKRLSPFFHVCSSSFSLIKKYFLPNVPIAIVLTLFEMIFILEKDLLTQTLIFMFVIPYPVYAYCSSVFITTLGDEVRLSNYSDEEIIVKAEQIISIRRVLLSTLYKFDYVDFDDKRKTKYFFPKGGLNFFTDPMIVRELRSMIKV